MRAIIIGGGIGGLSAAIGLRKVGIDCTVFERAPEPREVGAGISMWPNAMRALEWLGAAAGVRARGMHASEAQIRSWRGRVNTQVNVEPGRTGLGGEFMMIHRADLLDALLEQLPRDAVRWGRELVSVEESGAGSALKFADGSMESAELVVGADGLRSVVRAFVHGAERPRYSGQTCWRGVAEFDHPAYRRGGLWEIWGPGARFGITSLPAGQVYWWAAADAPEGGGGAHENHQRELLRIFGAWAEPVPAVIRATEPPRIFRSDLLDRPPRRGWSRGGVTLLGDAAHPMTPNLGQGGCTAIEDAVVLSRCVQAKPGDVAAALAMYERARFGRTSKLVRQSRLLGWFGQRGGKTMCAVRDAVFRTMAPLTMDSMFLGFGRYDAGEVGLPGQAR